MKTLILIHRNTKLCILFLAIGLAMIGCSEDDSLPNNGFDPDSDGISEEQIEAYEGDFGLIINMREMVKRGYEPTNVSITTTASQGDYDRLLNVDLLTNIAQLIIPIEDLSEEAEAELRGGVGVDLEILDSSNNVITSESYSIVSFTGSDNQIDIDVTNLPVSHQNLEFKEGMKYYLQLVDANGNYNSSVVVKPSSAGGNGVRLENRSSNFFQGATSEQFYLYKYQNEDNTFAIYSANSSRYLRIGSSTRTFRQSGEYSFPTTSPTSLGNLLRFGINLEDNGLYTIRGKDDNNPLRAFSNSGVLNWHTNGTGTIQYFRIIALDIAWEAIELDTEYLQPILPAVQTSFGFNNTLRNCGSGDLEQQVGIEQEVVTTYTSAISESVGLSARSTVSAEVSVSATAEASFFGNGGSVTGEVSAGIELSTQVDQTTTVSSEESVSITNTFFSNRTVSVPSGRASIVYDAFQTYEDVKVPFVKRLRLKGLAENSSEPLTGREIATQLYMSNFYGVITTIGSDFVEVSIKGNMFMDNIVDTQTDVIDIPANCN